MKLTVFGATGGIGGHMVVQALDRGHQVTAVVRDAGRFELRRPGLDVVEVRDLTDVDALLPAVQGRDAAVSGIGPRSAKDTTVASTTGASILRALDLAGVRRFVAVTAAPVGPTPPGESFLNRRILFPVIGRLLRGIYGDLAVLEDQLRRSDLDWTVVRPPRLTNGPLTGKYRSIVGANVPRATIVSRADVAHCMLAALDDPSTIRQPIGVAN
jgi:putative NADH-flavin reductase